MRRLALIRLAQAFITLFVTITAVFIFARLSGNPADVILPQSATPAEREQYIRRFGFDQPMYVQYGIYLQGLATGDFGESIRYRRPVLEIIGPRLLNSAQLAGLALVITLAVALPLGVAAAVWRGTWIERVALLVAVLGQAVPPFVLGVLLILVLAVWWHLFPAGGMDSPLAYVLPSVTLAAFIVAGVVRLLRSSMLDVLDSEYVKFARAKGVPEAMVIWKHALRNAAIPVTTFIGLMFGIILTGGVTVEVVYAWPGLGQLTYDSILARDYPLTQAAITTGAAAIILINFVVDLLYLKMDPRVRV